jgi:hypothetical protein
MPSTQVLEAMGAYNEELANAGVLVGGEGLTPSSRGKRVAIVGDSRKVVDGPFTESRDLVAGYWLWRVETMEQAIDWAKRCPEPMPGEKAELEIRPIYEAEDFGDEMTPDLRAREEVLRARVAES